MSLAETQREAPAASLRRDAVKGLHLASPLPNVNYGAHEMKRVFAFHNGPFSKNKWFGESGVSITGIKPEPPFLQKRSGCQSCER